MARKRMSGVLTVRLRQESLRVLKERARREGKTASDVVRTLVEQELGAEPRGTLYERGRRWIGAASTGPLVRGRDVRKLLETWSPDRRG